MPIYVVVFLHRDLFQYVEFDQNFILNEWSDLQERFRRIGLDPDYYLVIDFSSDLPYDFYRPGEEEERLPIHLLNRNGRLRELSRESDVVEAISGKKRTDHKLYYPKDVLDAPGFSEEKRAIIKILHG